MEEKMAHSGAISLEVVAGTGQAPAGIQA